MNRRDITGIARQLRVGAREVADLVETLSEKHGGSAIVAEVESALGNHELTEAGYEHVRDHFENSSAAVANVLRVLAEFMERNDIRRDRLSSVEVRTYTTQIQLQDGDVAPSVLFALDALANPAVEVVGYSEKVGVERRAYVDVTGRAGGHRIAVRAWAYGAEAELMLSLVGWSGTTQRIDLTGDTLRELAAAEQKRRADEAEAVTSS